MKIIIPFSFLLFLFSCKKEAPVPIQNNVSFKANNVTYSWDFVNNPTTDSLDAFIMKDVSLNTDSSMFMFGILNQAKKTSITLIMYTPKLEVKRYIKRIAIADYYAENFSYINGEQFACMTNDIAVVDITKLENNYASGTFHAVMHNVYNQNREMDIVDGYFNNILIIE